MKLSRIVVASNNPGKLRELKALLAPLGVELATQAELGIGEADEPHGTFIENALGKARHASHASGLPALADDSGICVDALNGAPGVHSARYATPPGGTNDDRANNRRLIEQLAGQVNRAASYYCVLVLLRAVDDPQPIIAEASWAGQVIDVPRGAAGFGYDPYFLLPELGQTAAELDPEHKNRISHRGQALRALVARLRAGGLS